MQETYICPANVDPPKFQGHCRKVNWKMPENSKTKRRDNVFKTIMVPVDLAHKEDLGKALTCAADLAGHYGAEVIYVGVTTNAPSSTAHNPKEYKEKLEAFAKEQSSGKNFSARAEVVISHDPRSDVDEVLLNTVKDIGADMVVMASHMPNILDYVWPSNGGKIAEHAKCTVMVVRC